MEVEVQVYFAFVDCIGLCSFNENLVELKNHIKDPSSLNSSSF